MSDFGLDLLVTAASADSCASVSPQMRRARSTRTKHQVGGVDTEKTKAKEGYIAAPVEHQHHCPHGPASLAFTNVPMPHNIERYTKNISEIFYHDYISSLKALSNESSRPSQALSVDITTVACYNIHKWSERVSSVIRNIINSDNPGKKPSPEDSRMLSIVIQTIESLANIRALYQILFPLVQGDLTQIPLQYTSDFPEGMVHSEPQHIPPNSVSSVSSEESVLAGMNPGNEGEHLKSSQSIQNQTALEFSRTGTSLLQKSTIFQSSTPRSLDPSHPTSEARVSQSASKGTRLQDKSENQKERSKTRWQFRKYESHNPRNSHFHTLKNMHKVNGNQNPSAGLLPNQIGSSLHGQDTIADCRTGAGDGSEKAVLPGEPIDGRSIHQELSNVEPENKGVPESDSPASNPVPHVSESTTTNDASNKRQRLIPPIEDEPACESIKYTPQSWTGDHGITFIPPHARSALPQSATHAKSTSKPNTDLSHYKSRDCATDVTQESINSSVRQDSLYGLGPSIHEPYTTYGPMMAVACLNIDRVAQEPAPRNPIEPAAKTANILTSQSDNENSQASRRSKRNIKASLKRNAQQPDRVERIEVQSNQDENQVSQSQEHSHPNVHNIDTSSVQDALEKHRSSSTDRSFDESRCTEAVPSSQPHTDRIHSDSSPKPAQNPLDFGKDTEHGTSSEPIQPPTAGQVIGESCIRQPLADARLPPEWLEMAAQYMRHALVDPYPDVLRVILSSQNELFSKASPPKKKPINAFLAFSLYVRAKHIAKGEMVDNRRLFRVLSQVWADASAIEKRKFEELGRVMTNIRNDDTLYAAGSTTTYNLNTSSLFVDQTNPYCFVWAPPY